MLRIVMAAAAVTVLASACGAAGGGKQVLIDQCVKDGDDKKVCECIVTAMEKHMDKDLFRAAVLESQGKTEEAQAIAEKVGADKAMASATAAVAPMLACAGAGAS